MKTIELSQGKIATVDDGDFEELSRHKWFYSQGYAGRNLPMTNGVRDGQIRMHQAIMGVRGEVRVDHENTDTLDNRRANLRICTHQQNGFNRGKNQNNTSGRKGVSWCKCTERWRATIMVDNKAIHIGRFNSKEEAASAYANAARELHGEFARV